MKCAGCKKEFDESKLSKARDENGNYPKVSKNLYCQKCEEEVYQRNVLVDCLHKQFLLHKYYTTGGSQANKARYKRLMALVNTQISNLIKDGYTSLQIRLILEYMIERERISFSDTILGLVPYYYIRTSKHHNEISRIISTKSFGYIKPTEEAVIVKPPHKANKKALRINNMELM